MPTEVTSTMSNATSNDSRKPTGQTDARLPSLFVQRGHSLGPARSPAALPRVFPLVSGRGIGADRDSAPRKAAIGGRRRGAIRSDRPEFSESNSSSAKATSEQNCLEIGARAVVRPRGDRCRRVCLGCDWILVDEGSCQERFGERRVRFARGTHRTCAAVHRSLVDPSSSRDGTVRIARRSACLEGLAGENRPARAAGRRGFFRHNGRHGCDPRTSRFVPRRRGRASRLSSATGHRAPESRTIHSAPSLAKAWPRLVLPTSRNADRDDLISRTLMFCRCR